MELITLYTITLLNITLSLTSLIHVIMQVTTSSIPYGFLEMLAEVGGYVGLFLGVSIQQLVAMPESFIIKLYKILF